MKVLINGRIKELKKTNLDTGYFYGYGAFETIHIRDGKAVLLDEHIKRLNAALVTLSINKEVTREDIEYAIVALRCYNVALKLNVSEGNILYSTRAITYTKEHYIEGAKLKTSKVFRNPTSMTTKLKSMNYMDNMLAMQEAKQSGCNDALFLNYKGEVCETCVANIFAVIEGVICTPPLECGLLEGVLRGWVLKRYDVKERVLLESDLLEAEGVFITNSLMGIMNVASIDDTSLNKSQLVVSMTKDYVTYLKEEAK